MSDDFSAADRSEKLALARKKLKQYQRKASSSVKGDSSAQSLNDEGDRQSLGRSCSSLVNHDDHRSPFQRVRLPSESSQVSSMSMPTQSLANSQDPSPSNLIIDTDYNNTSAAIAPNSAPVAKYFQQDNDSIKINMNGEDKDVNVNSKPVANEVDGSDNDGTLTKLQKENSKLSEEIDKQKGMYSEAMNQFQQLHSHYTQLHAAYTNISKSSETSSVNSKSDDNDVVTQMRQQQHTMSVLVDEKTELQSQLRQAMRMANEKHSENEELRGRLQTSRDRLLEIEKDTESQLSEKHELERALNVQKKELDKLRHESCQWQARAMEAQQDRTELQARLKVKSRELDRLQAEAGDTRKELHMKDIYIRQLTAAGAQPNEGHDDTVQQLESVGRESVELKRQLGEAHNAVQHWQKEAERQQMQYETYGRDLNNRIIQMAQQLEALGQEKQDLTMQLERFQADIDIAKENDTTAEKEQDDVVSATEHVSQAEEEMEHRHLYETIAHFETRCSQSETTIRDLESKLQDLESVIREKSSRIGTLEEELSQRDQYSQDSKTLVDQLHAQRTTVSRAVAQNRDLKEQLQELQAQFVKMSESNMESSSLLQTATFDLETMKNDLNEKEIALKGSQADVRLLTERVNYLMADNLKQNVQLDKSEDNEITDAHTQIQALIEQNAALRQKMQAVQYNQQGESAEAKVSELEQQLSQLKTDFSELARQETRARNENQELHRIMEQNDTDENQNSIRVELQQALNRINALADENNTLRAAASTGLVENGGANQNHSINSDQSSLCSEHQRDADKSLMECQNSMGKLEERFATAMRQNADLSDHNQHLEHLITQLQGETETIGEYITIYQHRRQVIRERLRQKEEAVARLAHEKDVMQKKLWQLQDLVMRFLQEKGTLHAYNSAAPVRGRAKRVHSPVTSRPRSASQSSQTIVDEISGEEMQGSILEEVLENGGTGLTPTVHSNTVTQPPAIGIDGYAFPSTHDDGVSVSSDTSCGTAEQIIRLLTEMQSQDVVYKLTPSDRNLHCKDCSGKLIVV